MIRSLIRNRKPRTLLRVALLVGLSAWVGRASATPMPWTVSNLSPDGPSGLVHGTDGRLLDGRYRVDLLVDRARDGIDPVHMGAAGEDFDTGDDSVVVSAVFDPEGDGFVPRGGFLFLMTIDPEDYSGQAPVFFVRVFDSEFPGEGARFASSHPFAAPELLSQTQTLVTLPDGVPGYVGNEPPELSVSVTDANPMAGEQARFTVSATDDERVVFSLAGSLLPGGGGGVEVFPQPGNEAVILWTLPMAVEGEIPVSVVASDGDLTDTVTVALNVLPPGSRPSSFALLSPRFDGPAFEGLPLRWEAAEAPGEDTVRYTFEWSFNGRFNDGGVIDSLIDPEVALVFEDPAGAAPARLQAGVDAVRPARNRDVAAYTASNPRQVKAQRVELADRGKRQVVVPGRSPDDAPVILEVDPQPVAIQAGQRFFWRVQAFAGLGEVRPCRKTFAAWAERADAPGPFDLLSPSDNANLETDAPSFSWQAALDSDHGDSLVYEVLWSVDGGQSFDTLSAGPDTTLDLTQYRILTALEQPGELGPILRKASAAHGEQDLAALPKRTHATVAGGVSMTRKERAAITPSSPIEPRHALRQKRASDPGLRPVGSGELDDLPQDVEITWKVDAIDLAGLRTSSGETRHFTLALPNGPSAFGIVSPAAGTRFAHPADVRLVWQASQDSDPGDEVQYRVMMGLQLDLGQVPDLAPVVEDLADTTFLFSAGQPYRQRWYWRVDAISGSDTTVCRGGTHSFDIWPDLLVEASEPATGAYLSDSTRFSWRISHRWPGEPLTSRVEVSADERFNPVENSFETTDTSVVLAPSDFDPGDYYWHVVVEDEEEVEWVSAAQRFTVPVSAVDDRVVGLPSEFAITSAYPNPFNPSINVVVALPERANATLGLYSILGRKVLERDLSSLAPGYHAVHLDLSGFATGVYLARFDVESRTRAVRKVMYLK